MSKAKVAILGAGGQLGFALRKHAPNEWDILSPGRSEVDLRDTTSLQTWLEAMRPEILLNASAYNAVEDAEKQPEDAFSINATAVESMVEWAGRRKAYFAHVSTDYVFAGTDPAPLCEETPTAPLNAYGRSKEAGEKSCLQFPKSCLIRTSAVFGPRPGAQRHNFVEKILHRASENIPFTVRDDMTFSPASAADLAERMIWLANNRASGIFHLTNEGQTTWFTWATHLLKAAGMTPDLLAPSRGTSPTMAQRPLFTVLANTHGAAMGLPTARPWQDALEIYLNQRAHA